MTDAERNARKYKKSLTELTLAVSQFLALLDKEMKQPSSLERGRTIGRLATRLDMANDAVLHFTFGQSFHSITNRKAKMERQAQQEKIS